MREARIPSICLLDVGTNSKGDYRRTLGHEIVDHAVELIGREHVGTAAAVADIDDGPRRLAVARITLHGRVQGLLQVAGAQRGALVEGADAAAISGLLGATNPWVKGAAFRSKATSLTRSFASSFASADCNVASDLAR